MASELFPTFDHSFFSDPFSPISDHPELFPNFDENTLSATNNAAVNEVASTDDDTISLEQIATQFLGPSAMNEIEKILAGEGKEQNSVQAPFQGGGAAGLVPEFGPRVMHRSFSSNSFGGFPAGGFNRPGYDGGFDQQRSQVLTPFATNVSAANPMRRVCSTGDLHVNPAQTMNRTTLPSSPEGDEPYFKVGKYTPAERREKIFKYRVKRSQRNFSKTIKYACRKTLADNRPRIRGRFARNDEVAEVPTSTSSSTSTKFHGYGHQEDQVWVGDNEGSSAPRSFGGANAYYNTLGSAPNYQYYNSY